MADAETAVPRNVARAEAGTAKCSPDDRSRVKKPGSSAVLYKLGKHRLACGINRERKIAVSDRAAGENVVHRHDIVINTAGAARDNALIDVDVAVFVDLIVEIQPEARKNAVRVFFQLAYCDRVSGVEGERDHRLDL